MSRIRSMRDLNRYDVTVPGKAEKLLAELYDYQTYANAGQTSLKFFQLPVGQSGKTLADTNMDTAGALPKGKEFIVTHVMVDLLPGVTPGTFGAADAGDFVNDIYTVAKSGYLSMNVGSKNYVTQAPIGKFPTDDKLHVSAALADTTTAGADRHSMIQYARMAGPVYKVNPIRLTANMNFDVSLVWPAAVALPSGVDARIGIRLGGILLRSVQ